MSRGKVIYEGNRLIECGERFRTSNYGKLEVVDVYGQPFEKAVRATVSVLPSNAYGFQMILQPELKEGCINGDTLLLKLCMRTVSGGAEDTGCGRVQVVNEENGGEYKKNFTSDVFAGDEWREFYVPFVYNQSYTKINIRLGYYIQCVELGGFEIKNYGQDVDVKEFEFLTKNLEYLDKKAQWRKDAWDRIEKIRKGDMTVIVRDADGNAVKNASVDVRMYEHEFTFGAAVNDNVISNQTYQNALSMNFNGAVPENNTKWVMYENNPSLTKSMLQSLDKIGIKNLRGHVLVWDRPLSKTWNESTGKWINNTSVPEYIVRATLDNNEEQIMYLTRKHIIDCCNDLRGYITEWDVLNEACANHQIQDMYGDEVVKEWFGAARESLGEEAVLYYNDYVTTQTIFDKIDSLIDNDVDFDGIGIQSHFSSPTDIESILSFYDRLASYGKRLKITEYDIATDDEILRANYTRDILIAAFSHEAVDGFITWSFDKIQTGLYYMMKTGMKRKHLRYGRI